MVDYITIIGLLAGVFTTIAYIPQVIKSWKTKKTGDISIYMFMTLVIGLILWLIYGILINSLPLIIANSIVVVLAFSILMMKIKYG